MPRRSPRRIIVHVATSADGYIARADGGVNWLDRPRTAGDDGMRTFYRSIDTILWGRKTYEVALEFQKQGLEGAGFDPAVKHCVFSRRLRAAPGNDIWMMGGAGIIGSFLDAGEVDEIVLHVIPTIIGEGIPLIAPRHRTIPLALRATRRFTDGVVRLHYAVAEPRPGRSS